MIHLFLTKISYKFQQILDTMYVKSIDMFCMSYSPEYQMVPRHGIPQKCKNCWHPTMNMSDFHTTDCTATKDIQNTEITVY